MVIMIECECEHLHGKEVEGPCSEVVDEGGVFRGAGGEGEVGFEDGIDEKGDALVGDGDAEDLEWGFPPRCGGSPFKHEGDEKGGGDDGEVLGEEMDEGQGGRADGDGGCE